MPRPSRRCARSRRAPPPRPAPPRPRRREEALAFIAANGITMNYDLRGPLGAPVVMFANSLGTSLASWDQQVATLAQRYRILRYDMRGHGLSEAPPGAYT